MQISKGDRSGLKAGDQLEGGEESMRTVTEGLERDG